MPHPHNMFVILEMQLESEGRGEVELGIAVDFFCGSEAISLLNAFGCGDVQI